MSDGGFQRFKFAAGVVVAAFVVPAAVWQSCEDDKKAAAAAFEGEVSTKYVVERRGRRFRTYTDYYVSVRTPQGEINWEVYESEFDEIEAGDYVVKLSGDKELAVFRGGSQVVDTPAFRTDSVPVPAALTEEPVVVEVPVPQTAMLPGAQAAAATNAAPGPLPSDIQGLLTQASGLWRAGEKSASIQASEKALYLTQQKFGPSSPEYRFVQQKVQAAKAMMAAQ